MIKLTGWNVIDPILSIVISLLIGVKAWKNFIDVVKVIVESVPKEIDIDEVTNKVKEIQEVMDVHHVHIWSLDEETIFLTMHVQIGKNVTKKNYEEVKQKIKEVLKPMGIGHSTIELEYDLCEEESCQ